MVAADRTLGNETDLSLARRCRGSRQEPRRSRRSTARRRSARAGHPGLERGRACLTVSREPDHRCHRHERKDDDDGAARRNALRTDRGQHRHGALRVARYRRAAGADRLRAVELPARGRRHVQADHRCAPQPRARPPRPARHLRGLPCGQAADLREPDRRGRRHRPARLRTHPWLGPADRVLGR